MRKVLSFVLVLALVLSSFSMAFAGSSTELKTLSDVSGNTNAEAIGVAYDLGIVTGNPDGTFQPTKAVTRAEFAAMITRALAIPSSALAGYANTTFKDTNGYAWAVPYLAFCNSKGIMLGDGAGNAMPGNTITVNEAVTMILRAVGYTANSAELVGTWPSNYVTKAQELKLYDDVAKDATGVDKANAAQIIYNALTVQKVAVNSDGDTNKLWDNSKQVVGKDETTLLSAGLNCTTDGKAVVTNSDLDDSLINMAQYIGQYGSIYRNSDDEIVAFLNDSDTLVGRFFLDGSAVKFKTTDSETEYTIDGSTSTTIAAVLLNGASNGGGNSTTIGAITDLTKASVDTTEYAISTDLTGKTIKTIYAANAWTVTSADQIAAADVADIKDDQSLLSVDFALDDNDNIDYTQFQLVGVNSLSDIKADDVVYVYADNNKSSNDIVKIEVGTQTATGVVKNYKGTKSDVATKFAIGANTYKNAAEVVNGDVSGGSTVDDGDVSYDVKAVLDARGYVYDFSKSAGSSNYAVVEKTSPANNIDDQVKVMLADGTEKTLTYDQSEKDCGTLSAVSVIGYGLDSSGEITEANKLFVTTTSIQLSSKSVISTITHGVTMGASTVQAADLTKINANGAKIDSGCVVFTIDSDGDYDVTTIDKVETGKTITGAVLLFAENNDKTIKSDYKVVAMLVPDSMAKSGTKSYGVLNEKNADSNDAGDKIWHAIGFKDGAKLDAMTDDKTAFGSGSYINPAYTSGAFNSGVILYEVKTDAAGVVTDATPVGATGDVKMLNTGFSVGKADDRNSVTDNATGTRYALSDKLVVYQLTSDNEYKVFTGNFKSGDFVRLYETNDDDDADGYDVVIMYR